MQSSKPKGLLAFLKGFVIMAAMNGQTVTTGLGQEKVKMLLKAFVSSYGLVFVILVFCIPVTIISPVFWSWRNLTNILVQMTVIGVLTMGQVFVLISGGGGIDLSIGSTLALSAIVGATFIRDYGVPVWSGLLATLLTGTLIGAFNGLVITKIKISPLITTLAVQTGVRGIVMIITGGADVTGMPSAYTNIVAKGIGSVSWSVIITFFIFLLTWVILRFTKYGRELYAVGGNEYAANVSGINVTKIRMIAYTMCGLLAALGGIITTARLYTAGPRAGTGMELTAISAAVIGGTSLSGGKGYVGGAVLGVIFLQIIDNTTNLMAIPAAYVAALKGAIILGAAILDRIRSSDKLR
jgi:ribose/xylose/arabinose/galactoside ABC-type transport system permease subunit